MQVQVGGQLGGSAEMPQRRHRLRFISHLALSEARPADPTDGGLVTVEAERVSCYFRQDAPGTSLARPANTGFSAAIVADTGGTVAASGR